MKFVITLIMLFYTFGVFAQHEYKFNEEHIKQNGISEILTFTYNLETGDSVLTIHDWYDTTGNLLKEIVYNEKGEVKNKCISEIDSNRLISRQFVFMGQDSIYTTIQYAYNKNNVLTSYKQLNPDGTIVHHYKKKYNKKGQNTRMYKNRYDFQGFLLTQKYFYRKDGQIKKIKSYSETGNLSSTRNYQYDKNRNLIALHQIVNSNKQLIFNNTYNQKNQKIEIFFPKKIIKIHNDILITGETEEKRIYNYETEGNLLEERTFENGKLISQKKFFYKKFGTK
ncbi:MAG: hypothetical protein ACK4ND_09430 [Cytophagaceae bacterium]